MKPHLCLSGIALAAVLIVGCGSREVVPERYRPTDAWDAYRYGLETAGLTDSALGRDWIDAARAAVEEPVDVELPYVEHGFFDPAVAGAVGYRFSVRRGQRVRIRVELEEQQSTRLFLDLFRLSADEQAPVLVASAPAGERRLAFEPRRDGQYTLRVQPELLRGGRFELRASSEASLEFPVSGRGVSSMWSAFGAPRDGGRRSHHGVDIFAPRGTPVLAASHAFVRRIEERELGGKVIWLFDPERNLHLYYAHLDSQDVEEGVWVEPGQPIGRVGNTGNARTTPSHLHFGVYARGEGPIDPDPFLRPPGGALARATADPSLAGAWAVTRAAAPLRRGKASDEEIVRQLTAGALLRIWGVTGGHYRVALTDGTDGFLPERLVEILTP